MGILFSTQMQDISVNNVTQGSVIVNFYVSGSDPNAIYKIAESFLGGTNLTLPYFQNLPPQALENPNQNPQVDPTKSSAQISQQPTTAPTPTPTSALPIAAIVGGAVGGFFGLLILIAIIVIIARTCSKSNKSESFKMRSISINTPKGQSKEAMNLETVD